MTTAPKPCKACGAEMMLAALDSFRGDEGPVAVVVKGMPALVCANGHQRFVYPEFVSMLMDFAADSAQLASPPAAVKRGLFKKHFHCSGCDTELPAAPSGKAEREFDASFENAAPFKLVIQVELHRCAQCSREQVVSGEDAAAAAFKAVAHGFRAADVHVDG